MNLRMGTIRIAAALATLAVSGGLTGPAVGRTAEDVQIVSPRADALHTSRTLTVVVRSRGEVTDFQAYVRGSNFGEVTDRFGSPHRGRWKAKLRLGRELVRGRNHLYVQVRRPSGNVVSEAVTFTVARRLGGMLRVSGIHDGTQRTPLTVHAQSPRGTELRARLNARNVARAFERDGPDSWRAHLSASDGLRFGRNRLTVTVFDRQGAYERVRRSFHIRGARPLVGAGRDRTARTGTPVRLDGSSTQASRRGAELRLHWRIVSRPEGSTATLSGASGVRPLLRPDVPGRYTIRLQASEVGAGAAADTVIVTAQPDVLPSGVPITTTVFSSNPGIQVGQTFYPMGSGWLQVLVLDRATLAPSQSVPQPNTTYSGDDAGMEDFASDVSGLSSDELVIVSPAGRQPGVFVTDGEDDLIATLNSLGAMLPGSDLGETGAFAHLVTGQWALIGIPGLPQGAAYQNIEVQLDPSVPSGILKGFFQQDTTGNFAFTWPPTYLTFDTQADGTSATQNVITVGSQTFTSATVANGQSAFHVVWLNSGSLALLGEYTAAASETGCETTGPVVCLSDLANALQSIVYSGGPALLLVATIGKPAFDAADGQAWATLTQALASMGAQQFVLLGLDGTGDYSFVGMQGLLQQEGPNSGTELSQVVTGSPTARLVGLLQRNRQSCWMAGPNGSPSPGVDPTVFQPSLQRILAQPDQPFPPFASPAEQAAERYIGGELGLAVDPQFGIRANYWQDGSIDWGVQQTTLANLSPCTRKPCSEGYQLVQQTLVGEFGDVATVRGFFTGGGEANLFGLFSSVFTGGAVTFTGISTDILKLYDPPALPPQGGNAGDILNAVTTIASGFTGPIPIAGSAISGAFNIARGVNMLSQALYNGSGGTPGLDTAAFQGDVYEWGQQLEDAWTGSLAGLGIAANLLVSDAGRLSAATALVNVTGADGGWGLDTASATALTTALQRSLTRYLWWTMLPVPVWVAVCPRYPENPGLGLPNVTPGGVLQVNWVQQSGSGYEVANTYLFLFINTAEQEGVFLDPTTLGFLFSPPSESQPDNLGLEKPYFFAGAGIDGNTPVTPGFQYQPDVFNSIQRVLYGC